MIKLSSLIFLLFLLVGCDRFTVFSESSFPNTEFTSVIAYQYKTEGEDNRVIEKQGKILSKEQVNTLLKIINDPGSFDDRLGLRCYEPELKFIFYNQKNKAVSNIEISFDCNQISSFPKLNYQSFSMDGFEKIKQELSIL